MGESDRWYEEFFGGLYGQVLSHEFYESRAPDEAKLVKRVLRLRKGQRALDVPCGMGRLTIPLERWGVVMTGVDLTAAYLRRARRRARAEGLDVRFVQADMRDIDFEGEFDAAFNWFGSFGYFSDRDNLAFAKRVLRALKPGGRFLIEGVNKSWLLTHWRSSSDTTLGRVRVLHRQRRPPRSGRIHSEWTFIRGGVTERRRISLRVYNGAELRALLRAAGFRQIEMLGRPPLGRLTRHSKRIMAVGRRPRE